MKKLVRIKASNVLLAYRLYYAFSKALNSLFSFIDRVVLAFIEEVKKHHEN